MEGLTRTVWVVIICFLRSLWKRATPLIAILLVSVAPEVKTMSFGSAPIRSATYCFGPVNLPPLGSIGNARSTCLSCVFNCFLSLPAVGVCATMWVTVLVGEVG